MKKECVVCGKIFDTSPSLIEMTCSLKCRSKGPWLKNVREGLKHRDNFWLQHLREGLKARDFFKEKNPRWRGGNSVGYLLNQSIKAWQMKELPFKCEHCNISLEGLKNTKHNKPFNYHHMDRNRHNNVPKNIILLCAKCHQNLHKNSPLYFK